jgi:tRNA(Ile)-lysidine synthase
VAFAGGALTAERGTAFPVRDGVLDAAALGEAVTVRAWRPGDRMRPLGLGGSRSLQDLFTDRRIPREARHRLPVLVAGDTVLWVPGVATAEAARVGPATGARVQVAWVPPTSAAPLNYPGTT